MEYSTVYTGGAIEHTLLSTQVEPLTTNISDILLMTCSYVSICTAEPPAAR